MRFYLLLICFLFFKSGLSQNSKEFTVESSSIISNQSERINAVKINIKFDVYTFIIYDDVQQVLFALRKYSNDQKKYLDKGFLLLYDIPTQQILWSRKQNNFNLHFWKDRIFFDEDKNTVCLSAKDGQELWKDRGGNFSLLIDSFNIAINSTGKFIDPETGKDKWLKGLNSEDGIEDFCFADSNTLLISSSGLYWINRLNGPILFKPSETSYTSTNGVVTNSLLVLLGATAGALGGVYVSPASVKPNFLYGISSNILSDTQSIYLASRKKINAFTPNGTQKWELNFKEGEKGASWLFMHHQNLVFIDKGYAYSDIGVRKISEPVILMINSTNGEVISTINLKLENDVLVDFSIIENKLILLSNKHLLIVNLDGGLILNRLTLPESGIVSASKLINKDELFTLDATKNRIVNADSSGNQNYYIKGINHFVLSTLINGMNQQLITTDKIFEQTDNYNDLVLYSGKDYSLICSKNGVIEKKIVSSGWWFATRDDIFVVTENSIQTARKKDFYFKY